MSLPDLVKALLKPDTYPEKPERIELIQTHISFIFLTPEYVYKVKKPVDFGFLDFTTLEKRAFYCKEEVRLNRRLAPSVYLGVVEITSNGGIRVGGRGRVVEYAVKMRRLRDETILKEMIKNNTVTEDTIRRIARRIAHFHRHGETNPRISAFGTPEIIRKNTEENFHQTMSFIGRTISDRYYTTIKNYTDTFLRENEGLFAKRVDEGFIKDCHGDIHSDHISVDDGIIIFDCIEFNERFRYSDTVSDIAFLSMDLDYYNRDDLSGVLEEEYFSTLNDRDGRGLSDFYKCYRAYVRGKVDGFKVDEAEVPDGERKRAIVSCRFHFHLAYLYATGGFRPMLIVVSGLSGTGKTTLSQRLAQYGNMVHISSDTVRKELAGIQPLEHRFEGYKKGIYTDEFTERTYKTLINRAGELLGKRRSVILDATFLERKYLSEAKREAERRGALFHIIECTADDDTVRARLISRLEDRTVSDARWEIYTRQKAMVLPIEEPHLLLDTRGEVDGLVVRVVERIF